ncbi:Zn-ribbon domain-containing OB-fold protein [Streptomyces longispororuber]|uniref:Zn-ribbon domain-containing OB-fold protein n=1 Tax=Streptomyces longispororuber TaxID=68230 RepID=UPI002108C209|nr:zinc ribbon domain-containing protein [Streptomyces longispororuber]MCQ4206539.1 zinc ribbon domain-containing protein [Streptomyces longispororuber]
MARTRTPVVADWFTGEGADFRLLGTRCSACSSVFFPREDGWCRNPGCAGGDLAEVPLSPRGRVWSYTDARYRPPEPYVSDRELPWQPYTLIAVELAAERLVVLGQGAPGVRVDDLAVGMEVEVLPGVLGEDGDEETGTAWTTWHWRPTGVAA